ncbi:MAG: substrate-binding domain-containing protein, partial [Cyanobacteria bacterium J06639_18]
MTAIATIISHTNPVFAQSLRGAGASFPQPLYKRYQTEYERETGKNFKYTDVGSGGGIRLFINKSVDFGSTTFIP